MLWQPFSETYALHPRTQFYSPRKTEGEYGRLGMDENQDGMDMKAKKSMLAATGSIRLDL